MINHAPHPCITPSYYGTNNSMHPKVLDINWRGYRYWMIETPDEAVHEHPSILVSDDGDVWSDPGHNPIVTPPLDKSFYSDPHLVFHDDTLYAVYRHTSEKTRILVRESKDGVNWSDEAMIISGTGSETRCPCILFDGEFFIMWTAGDSKVSYRGAVGIYGPWSIPIDCSGVNPWHMDVIKYKDGYMMVGTNGFDNLCLGRSNDGIDWSYGYPFLTLQDGWDKDSFYRASIVETDSGVDVWYSGHGDDGWRVGRISLMI